MCHLPMYIRKCAFFVVVPDSLFTQPVGQSCVKMWMKQRRSIVAERSVVAESVAPKCYTHCETGISSVSGKKHVMVQLSTTTGCATTC